MGKNIKLLILFLVAIFLLLIFANSTQEKTINWTETYGLNDKIPFGLKVFQEEATGLFKNQKIEKFSDTPYDFINNDQSGDIQITVDSSVVVPNVEEKKGAILSISDFYPFDDNSTEELLYFVEEGNTVFISATSLPDQLSDSLGFQIILRNHIQKKLKSTVLPTKEKFEFDKGATDYYFSKFDKNTTKILGSIHDENYNLPNFIEIKYGSGKFLLHLQPIAFTNYYLLKNNYKYIESVCSHLNDPKLYWYVEGKKREAPTESPLRFINSQPALKWAWRLSLFAILLFILFNAKRKQRIIPILEPSKNTTVDFAKTIGNLYFLEKNHKDIAEKKIVYFLEKIRKEYYIDTQNLNEIFIEKLHQKTGKELTDITQVIQQINQIKKSTTISEKEVITLNSSIEKLNL